MVTPTIKVKALVNGTDSHIPFTPNICGSISIIGIITAKPLIEDSIVDFNGSITEAKYDTKQISIPVITYPQKYSLRPL